VTVSQEDFGTAPDGTRVHRWTLERAGTRVRVLTYGGAIQSVEVPDRDGATADVALGLPDLDAYLASSGPYFGALIGRYANRIAGGRFTLDGRAYTLPLSDGPNCLHGGALGFDKRVWAAEPTGDGHGVRLSRRSEDGEEGFPGTLDVSVAYTLNGAGALRVGYHAVTDAPTHVNLTNHSYWNLCGADSGPAVGRHTLRLAASRYLPVDATGIPAGGPADVAGTRFDFRAERTLEAGYDHDFVLDTPSGAGGGGTVAARLYAPESGRLLTISTSEPGVQLYTADGFDGRPHAPGSGVALETQHHPDSPNRPEFPTTVVRPGGAYESWTAYAFTLVGR
jgi:aldose 1-epimerase